jgi:hypothetical protein
LTKRKKPRQRPLKAIEASWGVFRNLKKGELLSFPSSLVGSWPQRSAYPKAHQQHAVRGCRSNRPYRSINHILIDPHQHQHHHQRSIITMLYVHRANDVSFRLLLRRIPRPKTAASNQRNNSNNSTQTSPDIMTRVTLLSKFALRI